MSTEHEPVLSPKGCPIESFPEDPERLFTANGLTLDYPRIGWIAAGCCTFLATAISLVLIYRHYQYYTKVSKTITQHWKTNPFSSVLFLFIALWLLS